jgi:signal transduction histidine kinase
VVLAVSPAGYTKIQVGRRFKLAHWKAVHDDLAHGLHYVPDLDAMPSLSPLQREIRAEGVRSYIAVPLAAQGKLVGMLNLGSQEMHAFDADLQTAALEVGRRLALVMYNAYLFDELDSSHDRLEELSRRLVMLQEAERRAIARELHDEVGQTVTALSIHLDLASRAGADEQLQRLSATQRLVEDLADQLRRISLDLRPPMLDDLGLLPTLLWYFEWVAEQYRLDVTFEQHGIERRFDGDIETAVFRIVQEALTNVARHAQASAATVRLWADSATISAQIEDKGRGFEVNQALHRNSGGLRGMQERARLLGGKLVIEARPGYGTCLTALFPLQGTIPTARGDARQ